MLKKARLLTRPTLARRDAPCPEQGRSERSNMILPSLLVYVVPRMARMSPPLRASNEGLLRPRVARAQGTHRAILPLLADFFSILLGAGGQGQGWFIELTAHTVNNTQQGRLADHFRLDLTLSWEVHE
jgi:hypothetical protein